MLLSAMSVLVVAQSSSVIPEGLTNNPVFSYIVSGNVRGLEIIFFKLGHEKQRVHILF